MVKNNSESERGNPLLLLLFPISHNGYFICTNQPSVKERDVAPW